MRSQEELLQKEEETRQLQEEVQEARRRQEDAALKQLEMATSASNHVPEYNSYKNGHGDADSDDGMSIGNGACKFRSKNFRSITFFRDVMFYLSLQLPSLKFVRT